MTAEARQARATPAGLAVPARPMRVNQMRYESSTVLSLELVSAEAGVELPPFEPGAHIDIQLGPDLRRSYSLLNPADGRRYVVGIHRDPDSQGGSAYIHERLRVGDIVQISAPKNNFVLDETAKRSILIAGGIGITPVLCMARRLAEIGADWVLFYAARDRKAAAFLSELRSLNGRGGEVVEHFDDEAGGFLDIQGVVNRASPGAHFYCCGPAPMLSAFKAATAKLAADFVHIEYFSAQEEASRDGGFEIVLARQKRSLPVAPGRTILEVLLEEKVNVAFSCSDGVCGTCETRVLEGVPDHRDSFLTDAEKASNATMMICCSGARTPKLVLDL